MNRGGKGIAMLLALSLLVLPCAALAQSYSFPSAGVFVEMQPDWTLLCPQTLGEEEELLARLGADADVLRADWAAEGTVFEIFLPGSVQVRLNCVESALAQEVSEAALMTQAQRDAFLASYDHAPYENVAYSEQAPEWLRVDWAVEADGTAVGFSWLVSVRQGALYCLSASGVDAGADALADANIEVLGALSFLGNRVTLAGETEEESVTLPQPVEDDGVVTPVMLPGFDGISLEDSYTLSIQTLPGAELTLKTPTDSLRATAGEDGSHAFTLSTKQTKVYAYTLTVQAEGREPTTMEIEIRRELTGEEQAKAYQAGAQALDTALYEKICASPDAYQGQALSLRGKVFSMRDVNGLPCALVYSSNPGTGVWRNPFWVLLQTASQVELEKVYNIYGDVRGDALPVEGEEALAPVIVAYFVN